MKLLKTLGNTLLVATVLFSVSVTGPAMAAVVVNGVSYDHVGIVVNVAGSTITIGSKTFSLGLSGNVRRDKSSVPFSTVQPGTYVGVKLQPNARGLPLVTDLAILPQ